MTGRDRRGGYILVAVLGVMVVLTGFMAAGSVMVRSALRGAVVNDESVALDGLALGGVELAGYQLVVRQVPPAMVDGRRIRFAGGTITPHVVDEGGKADLNGTDPKLLANLFLAAGLDAASASQLVSRIVDRRGADPAKPQASPYPLLAGDAGVPSQGGAVQPRSKRLRGFQTIEQIRELGGLSTVDYRRLAPWLTVHNPDGKVDVMTASADILVAIPGLTRPLVAQILARRGDPSKAARDALEALLGDAANDIKTTSGPAYSLQIDAIGGGGRRKTLQVVIAASKSPNDPFLILDWRDGI